MMRRVFKILLISVLGILLIGVGIAWCFISDKAGLAGETRTPFIFEFAEFAGCYGAVPSFNQSRGLTASLAARAYGARLQQFRVLRVRFDPENRLLNQFFAEHIG